MGATDPLSPLTIFLFKADVVDISDCLASKVRTRGHRITAGRTQAHLFVTRSTPKTPSWARYLSSKIRIQDLGTSSSVSAVLVLPVASRYFAVAFGYGRHMLALDLVDESFGLRVCLNAIAADKIRSVDKKTFDEIAIRSREQVSRDSDISQFGLNTDKDLVRAVTGQPSDPNLGRRISGMDAVSIVTRSTIDELPLLFRRLLDYSNSKAYRVSFPWVDHLREVRDPATRTLLFDEVLSKLRAGDLDATWLSIPEVLDWTDVGGFRYSNQSAMPLEMDVYLPDLMKGFADPSRLTEAHLRTTKVQVFRSSDDQLLRSWTWRACLYSEIDLNGERYVLSDGLWYRISKSFAQEIDEAAAGVPESSIVFPTYRGGREDQYNELLAAVDPKQFVLFDKKLIPHGGGSSTIELCDVLSRAKDLIHVKRYGGSSTLSHLFSQALVAAELLVGDDEFRRKAIQATPAHFREFIPSARPKQDELGVALVVLSNSSRDVRLPFFSKVTLRNVATRLRNIGVRVSLTKIKRAGRS